ncbi:MAG: hypothetical protein RR327_09015, partial [Clostridia bacterium]
RKANFEKERDMEKFLLGRMLLGEYERCKYRPCESSDEEKTRILKILDRLKDSNAISAIEHDDLQNYRMEALYDFCDWLDEIIR